MIDNAHNDYSCICYFSETEAQCEELVAKSTDGLFIPLFYQNKKGHAQQVTRVFDRNYYDSDEALQQAIDTYLQAFPRAEKVFHRSRSTATPSHLIQRPAGQKPGIPLKKVLT